MKKAIKTKDLIRLLKRYYPEPKCALEHSNPLELLVATILSAQCTDERVNIVTRNLFDKYHSAEDYAKAQLKDLEHDLRSINFFRNKAKNIKAMADILVRRHEGKVPPDLDALVALPGVGRKTANVVMGNAFHVASGVVVDTHVARLSRRLGLTREKTPEKIEEDLMELVPEEHWVNFSHWLIAHGRKVCKARNPACATCFLDDICPKRMI